MKVGRAATLMYHYIRKQRAASMGKKGKGAIFFGKPGKRWESLLKNIQSRRKYPLFSIIGPICMILQLCPAASVEGMKRVVDFVIVKKLNLNEKK